MSCVRQHCKARFSPTTFFLLQNVLSYDLQMGAHWHDDDTVILSRWRDDLQLNGSIQKKTINSSILKPISHSAAICLITNFSLSMTEVEIRAKSDTLSFTVQAWSPLISHYTILVFRATEHKLLKFNTWWAIVHITYNTVEHIHCKQVKYIQRSS